MSKKYLLRISFLLVLLSNNFAAFTQNSNRVINLQEQLVKYNKNSSGDVKPGPKDTLKVQILSQLAGLIYETDADKALSYVKQQLETAQAINYQKGIADSYLNYGHIYDYQRNYDRALKFFHRALNIYTTEKNKPGIIDINNAIGVLYSKKGMLAQGQIHFLKALKISQKENDLQGMISSYNNLGIVYKEQGKLNLALLNYSKCLPLQLTNPDNLKISYTYLNIGEIYRIKKDFVGAVENFRLGLKAALAEKDSLSIANNYSNLGNLYIDMGRISEAKENHDLALAIRNKIDDTHGLFTSYMGHSSINSNTGKYNEAIYYAEKALNLVKSSGEIQMLAEAHRQLADVHSVTGKYKDAYNHHLLYKKYSDSIFNINNERKLTEQRMNFEFEQIQAKNKADALTALNQQKRTKFLLAAGLIAIAVTVILLLVRRYNRKSKNKETEYNKGINMLQDELSILEIESETLRIENENIQLKNDLIAAEKEHEMSEREKLQEKLDHNKRELASTTLYLFQKNEMLSGLKSEIESLTKSAVLPDTLKNLKSIIDRNLFLDADWDKFKLHFEQVHPDFFKNLEDKHPTLTAYEVRLYAYLHMKLSTKEIAGLLNISPASVIKAKVRLNKKLNRLDGDMTI